MTFESAYAVSQEEVIGSLEVGKYADLVILSGNPMTIDPNTLKDLEVCCGSPIHNAGYETDYKTLAKKNLEIFRNHGVKKIITS